MLSLSYFLLGITLYMKSRQELRENEALKSRLFRNYAIGYTLGGFGTLIWKIDMWYSTIHPEQNWLRPLYLDIGLEGITDSYLTIITFFFLGFSVMFMSLTVEKDVLQRKKPWFTLHLLIITCLLVPFSFNPISLNIIIIWWILALMIAVTNIGLIYLRIILKSRGKIRKITLYVVIGFLGTFLCVIFRDFGNFDYIFNILAIIFAIVFYYGMTKT
jgi:hypothetical protein